MALTESAAEFISRQVRRVLGVSPRKRIVFPEGGDARVQEAAARLAREGLADPILIGQRPSAPLDGVKFIVPAGCPRADKYASIYYERRRSKGITRVEAGEIALRPEYFAQLMVAAGDADGSVCGAVYSSKQTLRAMLQCIGAASGVRLVTSFFVLAVRNRSFGCNGLMAFCDGSIVVDPSAGDLANMAITTARSVADLFETEPVVALLSYSTKGSGGAQKGVQKVVEALRIAHARAPDLHIDGELQADAALVPAVGASKAPGSTVAGRANTLIFPDLASANIAVKMVERLGDATAIGPITQGLARPANDLSRGCSAEDIFNVAVITCVQAARP
jgi:phosphate acetyltransferase